MRASSEKVNFGIHKNLIKYHKLSKKLNSFKKFPKEDLIVSFNSPSKLLVEFFDGVVIQDRVNINTLFNGIHIKTK